VARLSSRKRAIALLAVVLQIFVAVALPLTPAFAGPGEVPCPMHAGMMLPASGPHHPGQHAPQNQNCPCCGSYCSCSSATPVLPVDWSGTQFIEPTNAPGEKPFAATWSPDGRFVSASSARGPPRHSA